MFHPATLDSGSVVLLLCPFVITCQHLPEVKVWACRLEIGDWTVCVSVVGDVVNGADKWILMLFPTQPLTHSQTSPLVEQRERTWEGQKAQINTAPFHLSSSSMRMNQKTVIEGYFVRPRLLLLFPSLPFLCFLCSLFKHLFIGLTARKSSKQKTKSVSLWSLWWKCIWFHAGLVWWRGVWDDRIHTLRKCFAYILIATFFH